jgi:uncharacterized membrane protein YoaK (UPF0700 family)
MTDRNAALRKRLAVALAASAGFVDVVGYLTLHHVFTAHMTGNTSKLGVALGHGALAKALPLAIAPFLFAAGIAAGTVLVDRGRAWAAIAVQAALVAAYMAYGSTVIHHGAVADRSGPFYALEVLAILALGLQTAALTEIDGATVRTSYVSGVLTNLTQGLVRREWNRPLTLLGAILVAYLGGATLASYTLGALAAWCLAIPLAVLLAVALELRRGPR